MFSVLIPTTGRMDLVEMALKSVLEQTFQDFEIVISDSGKNDQYGKILAAKDPRINYFNVKEEAGKQPFITWESVTKRAKGKYILWLDDDNYLLPFALELFKKGIEESGAEIVTTNHLYYYDAKHPRHYLRNSLGIIPFTGKKLVFSPHDFLKSLLNFSERGPGKDLPRFHPSAIVVSKNIVDKAFERLGFVFMSDWPVNHAHHTILSTFAKSCFFIDRPAVIVGRLGVSMSQAWSLAAKSRFKKISFNPTHTPVTAYTKINAILEHHLRIKEILPETFSDIEVNYNRFAEIGRAHV